MSFRVKTIPAGEFKARCLALLDRVARTGEPLIVTKRGRPVAKLVPVEREGRSNLVGSVIFHEDVVASILDSWNVES